MLLAMTAVCWLERWNQLDSLRILIRLVVPEALKDFAAKPQLVDRT
jgi:hypothetical protein